MSFLTTTTCPKPNGSSSSGGNGRGFSLFGPECCCSPCLPHGRAVWALWADSPCFNFEEVRCSSGIYSLCNATCATQCSGDRTYNKPLVLPGVEFELYYSGTLVFEGFTNCSGVVFLEQPEHCGTYCYVAKCAGFHDCSGCFHSAFSGDLILEMQPRYVSTGINILYQNDGDGEWTIADSYIRWDRNQYYCPPDQSDGESLSCYAICRYSGTSASLGITYGVFCTGCKVEGYIEYYDVFGIAFNTNRYQIIAGMSQICGLDWEDITSANVIDISEEGDLQCPDPDPPYERFFGTSTTTPVQTIQLSKPGFLNIEFNVVKGFNYLDATFDRVFFYHSISCPDGEHLPLKCPEYCSFCVSVIGEENCLPLAGQNYEIYNKDGDKVVFGTLDNDGGRCFSFPTGGAPYVFVSLPGNCYDAVSGNVYCSGVVEFRAPTASECVVHYDGARTGCVGEIPCTLCDGLPIKRNLNMSDNFGSRPIIFDGAAWNATDCVEISNACYKDIFDGCNCLATSYSSLEYNILCENDVWKIEATIPWKSCGCSSCTGTVSCSSGLCGSYDYAPQYYDDQCTIPVIKHADCIASKTFYFYQSSGDFSVSCDPLLITLNKVITNEFPCNESLYTLNLTVTE